MITIFKKELRDLLPWIAVGMIVVAVFCWQSATSKDVSSLLPVVFASIAVAFGFLQTIGDMRTDAKGYLLHRPISVKKIFWGKVFAGFVGYVLTITPPLLGLAIYFEAIGPQRSPTSAWDLSPALVMSVAVFAFHPAAIWTMARQAKWFGSKTAPLVFAGLGSLLTFGLIYLSQALPHVKPMLALALLGFSVLATLYVTLASAAHAFCESQFLQSTQSDRRAFRIEYIAILMVSVFLISFISTYVDFGESSVYPITDHQLAMSEDGQLWDFAETQPTVDDYWNTEVSIAKINADDPTETSRMQPLPEDWDERKKAMLYRYPNRKHWSTSFGYVGQMRGADRSYWNIYEHDDRLLLYGKRLLSVLTPTGFYDSLEDAQGKFEEPTFIAGTAVTSGRSLKHINLASGERLVTDRNGVYQVDWNARTIRTILNQPNDGVSLVLPEKNQEAVFWVKDGTDVLRFKIEPSNEDDTLEMADSALVVRAGSYRLPEIKTTKTDQWSLGSDPIYQTPQNDIAESLIVAETAEGKKLFYRDSSFPIEMAQYQTRSPDNSIDQEGTIIFPAKENTGSLGFALLMPPVFTTVATSLTPAFQGASPNLAMLIPFVLMNILLAAMLTFWLTHRYALSKLSRNIWLLLAVILGFAAPLAMWMIYPKIVRETCHHCEAMRRIDRDRCRQCGADWAKPPLEGNEILGTSTAQSSIASVVHS